MNSDLYNFWLNTCHPMMYRDDVVYKMTYDKEQDNLVVKCAAWPKAFTAQLG